MVYTAKKKWYISYKASLGKVVISRKGEKLLTYNFEAKNKQKTNKTRTP